jgi:hypothetical protein
MARGTREGVLQGILDILLTWRYPILHRQTSSRFQYRTLFSREVTSFPFFRLLFFRHSTPIVVKVVLHCQLPQSLVTYDVPPLRSFHQFFDNYQGESSVSAHHLVLQSAVRSCLLDLSRLKNPRNLGRRPQSSSANCRSKNSLSDLFRSYDLVQARLHQNFGIK